jgi:queuine tRNA-ribosyltransferase
MCLDVCLPAGAPRRARAARRHDDHWAQRRPTPRAAGPAPLRHRAGRDDETPRRSIEEISALRFDGFALGGLAVGESKEEMLDCVEWALRCLPRTPALLHGIGDPEGILEVVARGIDMFDCVLPTRTARTGSALTWAGGSTSATPSYRTDPRPLDEELRLPGLRTLLARVHPAPRDAARDSRTAAAEPA